MIHNEVNSITNSDLLPLFYDSNKGKLRPIFYLVVFCLGFSLILHFLKGLFYAFT